MKFIAMDLIHGFRFKQQYKVKNLCKEGVGLSAYAHFLVIRLPNSWILKLVARTLVLALVIASLPQISSIIGGVSSDFYKATDSEAEIAFDSINFDLLPLLFRDLKNEGILKMGDRALLLGNKNDKGLYNSDMIRLENGGNEMDFVSFSDSEKQGAVTDETFDFAFTQGFHAAAAAEFIGRTLKVGGVAAVQLSEDPAMAFEKPDNFQIVYVRRFDTTIIGMRKTSGAGLKSPAKRKLCGVTTEAKKAALKKLEDVLLEPPRAASGKSQTYLKRTRYLPDLLGDSLESYPRRVFIDVGLPEKDGAAVGWFEKHYPRGNKDFELYNIETVTEEFSGKEVQPQIGMSDWLRKNVREEEYVVMKAEAEVVEEMVKSRVLGLVDELFLECKYKGLSEKSKKSRRAYWECLALYGRLRDEGVAVHQWWG
ncbi:hypothetical protein RHGRI_016576 [Rhododendron griersonianum]|uniref:DUF7870 domain-containing protein n=1 Tax=Rhododendron griersonianum TaxID=479676 RepID=A0AAV6JUL6_9ERIC|nr:hypothetical protein RHGRI_016576 [Rhododendron griersonianum]